MRDRVVIFWSYVTFFPCLYFALTEEVENQVRKETDRVLYQWFIILLAWTIARVFVWLVFQVYEWNPMTYLPSMVLFLGWVTQAVRGLRFLLL